jgi:DHA1 family bicyclomycin/chloramphenicol resistance-like MFS transporter
LFSLLLIWFACVRLRETNSYKNPKATELAGLVKNYGRIVASPVFWAYALPGSLSYSSIFVFIAGSSFVLIRVLEVPTQYYGYCFGTGVVGYFCGTLLCRRLLERIGLVRTVTVGSTLGLSGGLVFTALVFANIHHWAVLLVAMFITMSAHGINYPCAQSGAVAPFPQQAGAAAALLGFFTMLAALLTGSIVGATIDGTLYPMAIISATNGILLFASAQLLTRQRLLAIAS